MSLLKSSLKVLVAVGLIIALPIGAIAIGLTLPGMVTFFSIIFYELYIRWKRKKLNRRTALKRGISTNATRRAPRNSL